MSSGNRLLTINIYQDMDYIYNVEQTYIYTILKESNIGRVFSF